jgi:phenylalanyl-tRNA synthetase beta chain
VKVSLNWLKEFIDIDVSTEELLQKIGSQLGAVETIEYVGKKYQDVVIAEVKQCMKHPNADKLSLCYIDDNGTANDVKRNEDGLVQVVCGAPNVKKGMKVAWLPPGSVVPSTANKTPFKLESREIRGKVSNGMLASGSELAINDDHNGIVELTIGDVGANFAEVYMLKDEFVIDIENKMFTHRPDCFGVIGVAREISGILGKQFPELHYNNWKPPEQQSELELAVNNSIPELVPRFMARVIEDIQVGPSPVWVQARLQYAGIKPINGVVDATNYNMQETAQPLHAYDYDKLCKVAGTTTAQLETRLSKKGDKLKLLNGKTIIFEDEETILITSNDMPVGIGGIMGGSDTAVDKNTKRIVLEVANFDMYSVRRASMRHGLFTDSVTRFNKGQSPLQCETVLNMTTDRLDSMCQSEVRPGMTIDVFPNPPEQRSVKINTTFINDRLGLEFSVNDVQNLLRNVQFTVTAKNEELRISAPFWRTDIDIPEDIVEEVGRLHGYDNLPQELPIRSVSPPVRNQHLDFKKQLRDSLYAYGANEALTYNFVHRSIIEKAGQDIESAYEINNALSPDLQYYRSVLLPSLLEKIHPNIKRDYKEFSLFEFSKVHSKDYGLIEGVPNELNVLGVIYTTQDDTKTAFYELKNLLETILKQYGIQSSYRPFKIDSADTATIGFQAGRCAEIMVSGETIGVIGEFNPRVKSSFKLPNATAGLELNTKSLLKNISQKSMYNKLSVFPSVSQDITLKTPATVSFEQIYGILAENLLNKEGYRAILMPLDIFQREGDNDNIQYTFRLKISHYDKTLTSGEVNNLLDSAASIASEELNAERI